MPKKTVFEKDLITVAISRRAHTILMRYKRQGTPIYHLLDLIIAAYYDKENETRMLRELLDEAVEGRKFWKAKYDELKTKQEQGALLL